ncbi:MAG: HDOD domain-containing protein, partial [Candidatus Eisenbacteria sp.]|nr:HDOD domain-containing protein [Candidatus Eisenbacteria bacterium]
MDLKRVLLIHPDREASGRFASRLSRSGPYAVTQVQDGFDAAWELLGGPYDCMILHVSTRGLKPTTVIRKVREAANMSGMRILILCPDSATRLRMKRIGADDLLLEPIEPDALIEKTSALVGLKTPQTKKPTPQQRAVDRASRGRSPRELSGHASEVRKPRPATDAVSPKDPVKVQEGLFDEIWSLAQKGPATPGLPPRATRLDILVADRTGDLVSKELIAVDPSLVVGVLRMSNSVGYRGHDPISDLGRAVQRIGQRQVAKYLLQTWTMRATTPRPTLEFLMGSYWKHSLVVACIAEEIAGHLRYRRPGAAFSAGVLHDVGKLFLIHYFEEVYRGVLKQAGQMRGPRDRLPDISPIEHKIMKIDHGIVGYELCRAWALPAIVGSGTLHHHLERARVRGLQDWRVTVIVALADLVVRAMSSGSVLRSNHLAEAGATRGAHQDGGALGRAAEESLDL